MYKYLLSSKAGNPTYKDTSIRSKIAASKSSSLLVAKTYFVNTIKGVEVKGVDVEVKR
jgi:hypothetical protein